MCNGNVLRVQSGSTTVIWFTLPDSFQKTFSQPSFLGYFYTNQITLLKLSPTMDPTAAGLQWLRIIWLGFLRRRCPRAQQPLLCSQGSHEHPMKCSNTRVHQEWCFKFVIFPFSPPLNFWCGNTLDTQSLSTLHMCNGNVLSIQSKPWSDSLCQTVFKSCFNF